MSYTSKGTSEILVAGLQDQMFTIDVEKGTVTKQVVKVLKIKKCFAEPVDTYGRSIYENEAKSIYMCCHAERFDQYPRLDNLQYRQDLECPCVSHQRYGCSARLHCYLRIFL